MNSPENFSQQIEKTQFPTIKNILFTLSNFTKLKAIPSDNSCKQLLNNFVLTYFKNKLATRCELVKILKRVRVRAKMTSLSPSTHPCLKLRIIPLNSMEKAS